MKIIAVDTIQVAEYSNLVWLELHTREGLGETLRNPATTVAYIHETCAPYLLGNVCALATEVGNHFMGFPAAASRCAATRRSTSRSATCSARRRACRAGSCSAA